MAPREVIAIRESLGLKQIEFAELLGVDQSTISNWESGRHPVRPHVVKLIRFVVERQTSTAPTTA